MTGGKKLELVQIIVIEIVTVIVVVIVIVIVSFDAGRQYGIVHAHVLFIKALVPSS